MKKIAVFLPAGYRGGMLKEAKSIAKAIVRGAEENNDKLQVVFSYSEEGQYEIDQDFKDLLDVGISLRPTKWMIYSSHQLSSLKSADRWKKNLTRSNQYCLPVDGANDFADCDFWLIVSDRLPEMLFPLRDYACVIYDYIQRYVPGILSTKNELWKSQNAVMFSLARGAIKVFVTTPVAREDMISFVGLPREKIELWEMRFTPPITEFEFPVSFEYNKKYFIWPTNAALHKNHQFGLESLEKYFLEFSGSLDVVITGANTEILGLGNSASMELPNHLIDSRNILQNSHFLPERVRVFGNVPDNLYTQMLMNAEFIWSPVKYDNGAFAVIEGAYLGKPSLSTRYPAMEYIDRRFNLQITYPRVNTPYAMADKLKRMEQDCKLIKLPSQEQLDKKTWEASSHEIYQSIKQLI
jgi:glycosyltransferase involved in cell wall biosynthesis